ncbi:MAG: benzoyl-CoA reductase subunit D [Deltaproteobacteria bacterium]|nr:benzoyl-CoA reductase subunit D [Deltaproteobacteria bacterium]
MSPTIVTAGIDIGTSAVKAAVVRSGQGGGRERQDAVLASRVAERIRRRDPRQVIRQCYEAALAEAGVDSKEVAYVATTGEGELCEFRVGHFYGMTAHARGALFLDPEARAAVDVGALHGRAIRLDERSKVLGYQMTSQCASGTGQFLENIARYLGVTLEEIGPLSTKGDAPEKISGICAVLAETDVINLVSRGISVPNILRGIHESMAGRLVKLLRAIRAQGVVLLTGGLATDEGLLCAMRDEVKSSWKAGAIEVRTHADGVHAGAIGAALWGAYRHERLTTKSSQKEIGA